MGEHYYRLGKFSEIPLEGKRDATQSKDVMKEYKSNKRDDDLIIEDNTVYEIDRECYDRIKKQKKR
jgi:hypothetical protein